MFSFFFNSFLNLFFTVSLLFKCRFVAWRRGFISLDLMSARVQFSWWWHLGARENPYAPTLFLRAFQLFPLKTVPVFCRLTERAFWSFQGSLSNDSSSCASISSCGQSQTELERGLLWNQQTRSYGSDVLFVIHLLLASTFSPSSFSFSFGTITTHHYPHPLPSFVEIRPGNCSKSVTL